MHCIPLAFSLCFVHIYVCLNVENYVLLGLDWVEPIMQLFFARHMFMHISCISTLSFLYFFFWVVIVCSISLSLSLSWIDCAWHSSINLLQLETLFVLSHLLLLIFPLFMFGFVMRRPVRTSLRTFLNVAFIQSAM